MPQSNEQLLDKKATTAAAPMEEDSALPTRMNYTFSKRINAAPQEACYHAGGALTKQCGVRKYVQAQIEKEAP
jgi:hypothetical protein